LFITSILVLIVSPQPPAYRLFFSPIGQEHAARNLVARGAVQVMCPVAFMEESWFRSVRARLNCPQILGYLVKDIPSDVRYRLVREV
jgi:hypothetical protein